MLEPKEISRVEKLPLYLVEHLLTGISKTSLEELLQKEYNPINEAALDILRMNTIGGLRASGYVIPKERGQYKITGYEAKRDVKSIDQYGGDCWDWVSGLEPVVQSDREWVESQLQKSRNVSGTHESSWGYIWCYELARDRGYKFVTREGYSCIIMQKHQSTPRFRIFNFSLPPEHLCLYAQELAKISRQAVRALFLSTGDLDELRKLDRGGYHSHRRQAIYKISELATNFQSHVNKRMMTGLRKADREIEWFRAYPDIQPDLTRNLIRSVIGQWKEYNESKHRQLAITRDFQCVDSLDEAYFAFLGLREQVPCTTHLLDRIINQPAVAQIVEKSLNYSAIPGGKYGTADLNLWKTCLYLAENYPELEYINAGGYDGGGVGLEGHKAIYALPVDDVRSATFDFSFPYLSRKEVEIDI